MYNVITKIIYKHNEENTAYKDRYLHAYIDRYILRYIH